MNALKFKSVLKSTWSAVVLTLVLATGMAQAGNVQLTSFDGNQATIVGQGFSKSNASSFQVNIYVDGKFIEDINTNANGSFSYTTPSGRVSARSRIEAKVLNWNGNGNHESFTIALSGNGQQTPPPREPPAEPPYRMDPAKLREYGEVQARTVANRVANTYGELERWKYSFTMGYWRGIDDFNGSYTARAVYDSARIDGRNSGGAPGYNAGFQEATSQAGNRGTNEAVARFRFVVNQAVQPDVSVPNIATPAFGGLKAPVNACDTVTGVIGSLENRLSIEMRVIQFGDDDGYLAYDPTAYSIRFNELNVWGHNSYKFVDSWFRKDYAWQEWMNNDLNGKYNKVNYRKMQSDQQAEFRRVFENVYDGVIDEKYYRKQKTPNPLAFARGRWYGTEIAGRQTYDRGCNTGYTEAYTPASVNGYREAYTPAYRARFESTVTYYNTNPVISIDGIQLVDGNQNGVFELGETLGIAIGNVTNLGRVAAKDLRIVMNGDGIDALSNNERVTIEASTSKESNQVAENLARIRNDVIADQSNSVVVSVGATQHSLVYVVSWKRTIQALATASAKEAESLKKFVLQNIQDEYTRMESTQQNIYSEKAKKKVSSKLRDLVDFYEALPENQRSNILSMAPAIVTMKEKAQHNQWSTGKLRKDFAALAARIK